MEKNTDEDGWWRFLELCRKAPDSKMLSELLHLFLTHEERKDLGTRYLIIRDLTEGKKTQREMAQDLSVSIAKITRGSNCLKEITPALRSFLEGHMS